MFRTSMSSFFNGKVVIVTGASSGIGKATAVMFAKAGAKVTITGRKAETLEETKELCSKGSCKDDGVLVVIGDITNEEFAAKLVQDTVNKFDQLDVLVNNAGSTIFDMEGRKGLDIPVKNYDDIFHLNVRSIIILSQYAVPHLEKTKGAIVNISAILSLPMATTEPYYPMSKAALDQLTVQMAGTLIEKGIRVNSVNPGVIRTNFLATGGVDQKNTPQMYDALLHSKGIPLGRVGAPDDIAKIILFLADRSQSEIIIGQRIIADGGSVLKYQLMTAFDQ